jgi:predicted dehydrogenase
MTQDRLPVAVVGAGKMGSLHSRIYSQMDSVDLVAVVDADISRAQKLTEQYGGTPYSDPAEILDSVRAVTVAVPTEFHMAIASPFLRRGIPVLVEKPLASTLEQARALRELAAEHNCLLQVGYSERFNPVIQAMKRMNVTPRMIEAQRISPFTFRSTDVGVVLDIMIHDLDIILSMVSSEVTDVQAVGVNVIAQHEDVANARLTFANGCVVNLTASRLALKTERKLRLFSEDAYVSLDNFKKTGVVIRKTANKDILQQLRKKMQNGQVVDTAGIDWTELVQVESVDIDDREPLRMEQEAFVRSICDGVHPEVSAADAVKAMELAQQIVESIRSHHWSGTDAASFSSAMTDPS